MLTEHEGFVRDDDAVRVGVEPLSRLEGDAAKSHFDVALPLVVFVRLHGVSVQSCPLCERVGTLVRMVDAYNTRRKGKEHDGPTLHHWTWQAQEADDARDLLSGRIAQEQAADQQT